MSEEQYEAIAEFISENQEVCEEDLQEQYEEGWENGYDDGRYDGFKEGYKAGKLDQIVKLVNKLDHIDNNSNYNVNVKLRSIRKILKDELKCRKEN